MTPHKCYTEANTVQWQDKKLLSQYMNCFSHGMLLIGQSDSSCVGMSDSTLGISQTTVTVSYTSGVHLCNNHSNHITAARHSDSLWNRPF